MHGEGKGRKKKILRKERMQKGRKIHIRRGGKKRKDKNKEKRINVREELKRIFGWG